MDKDEIKEWLQQIGKDRTWLAAQVGCTPGTLNQWFSKLGFPEWGIKSINRLMNPSGEGDNGLEVTFSAREFERIETARKLLGIATRKLYYEEAITEYTDQILERENAAAKSPGAQNITHFPAQQPSSLVAEDSPPYGSSSGKKKPRKKNGTED